MKYALIAFAFLTARRPGPRLRLTRPGSAGGQIIPSGQYAGAKLLDNPAAKAIFEKDFSRGGAIIRS